MTKRDTQSADYATEVAEERKRLALTRNAMPYDPEIEGIKGLLFFIFVMPFVVAWALLCHLFGVEWDEGGERNKKGKDEQ